MCLLKWVLLLLLLLPKLLPLFLSQRRNNQIVLPLHCVFVLALIATVACEIFITTIPLFAYSLNTDVDNLFFLPPVFGHNGNNIVVPISKHSVVLDGLLENKEWNDAFKFNFTSPRISEGYVSINLKYDLAQRALIGGFEIPDGTPWMNVNDPDQIAFLFDTVHSASNRTQPSDHQIVFTRGQKVEYYVGNNITSVGNNNLNNYKEGDNGPALESAYDYYRSIRNSTDGQHTLSLATKPFAKVDFNTRPNISSWQGEFKIHFIGVPRLYGFAMQQKDLHIDSFGSLKRFFINYPINSNITGQSTQVQIPSTWGDISFVPMDDYIKNTERFCPADTPRYFTVNYDKVLCTNIHPQSIEEKPSAKLIIRGSLGDLINGSGIKDRIVQIIILDPSGSPIIEPLNKTTGYNGTFISSLSDLSLDSPGKYRILVKPVSNEYQNLTSTAYLDVMNDVLTTDEFIRMSGTYIGVITAVIALIAFLPKIKSYYSLRKQRRNLVTQLEEINNMYDEIHALTPALYDKQDIQKRLRDKRDHILHMFEAGELTQDHYSMLNSKISEYLDKLDQ